MFLHAVIVVSVLMVLSGCTIAGPVGEYQGSFSCKGKGTISGTGQQSLTVIGGGAGQNTFSLMVDCGEGLTISRDRARYEDPTTTLPAK